MSTKASHRIEAIIGVKLTLGKAIWSLRRSDQRTQQELAKALGVSKQYLCDLEHDRKEVSLRQAAKFAALLGQSEKHFVRLAIQDLLLRNNMHYEVDLHDAA